jgi:hypothetical protein
MTPDELQTALAERDREIVSLKAELARLRPAPPPLPTVDGPFQVPSPAEVAKLIDIAVSAYPRLRPKSCDHERLIRSVRFCLAFIGTVNRTPVGKVDDKYRERWADRCREWVTKEGVAADITALSFCIGILCAGDVDFIDPNSVGHGGVLNYGLTDGVGRRPRNGWLHVLSSSKPREALMPPMIDERWRPAVRRLPQANEKFLPGRIETI